MKKRLVILSMVGVSALFLSGCATTNNKVSQENDNLKIQIQNLQTQLQQKETEADSLRQALSSTTEEKYAAAKLSRPQGQEAAIDHPKVKDVQIALKNAGFDPGTPDGRMGKKTRQMIKDFQKANGLDADGKVGKKTWAVLSPYLEKTAAK